MLGSEAVVDADYRHAEDAGDLGAQRIVGFEVADHPAAAVEEDDNRAGAGIHSGAIRARWDDVAVRRGDGEVGDVGDVTAREFGDLPHHPHHAPRGGGITLLHLRTGCGGEHRKQVGNVGTDERHSYTP